MEQEEHYYYNVEELLPLTPEQLQKLISTTEGLKLSDLKISDLVFYKNQAIYSGNGVYIFKEAGKVIYVGKCSSRSFVERIASHFDVRHNSWLNSMLVHLIRRDLKRKRKEDKTNKNLQKYAEFAFGNFSLIIINFQNYDKLAIGKLESLLRSVTEPLNSPKRKTVYNSEMSVGEIINHIDVVKC